MNKKITLILLFFSFLVVQAQESISKKEGIYRTFSDFKNNRPFAPLGGGIKVDTVILKEGFGKKSEPIIRRKFVFDSKDEKKKYNKRIGLTIFGYSDGKDFYMATSIFDYDMTILTSAAFDKIYEVYKGVGFYKRIRFVGDPNGGGTGVISNEIVLLDTGERISLRNNTLKKFIKNDKELLKKFKNQKKKYLHLTSYVKQFLDRKHSNKK